MHLLREGQFDVASTFISEATKHPVQPEPTAGTPNPYLRESWEQDLANGTFNSQKLQQQFGEMYHILHELRTNRNLRPAIEWARNRSDVLEARGSNLEFELCQLQFICLFIGRDLHGVPIEGDEVNGPLRAWAYARSEFGPFQNRYAKEVQQLMGAMAFAPNVSESPYRRYFYNDAAWEEVASSFTREFCSLLGLSADSPLYIAATAGAIALPTLLKLQNIMKEKRTEWTTQDELPVGYFSSTATIVAVANSIQSGRDPAPAIVPLPLHLRLSCLERAVNRRQSTHDDALRTRHCPGESRPDK
jgi:hypothetical protein